MCGITGVVARKNEDATSTALKIITLLSYRGYDSAGVGFLKNGHIIIKKTLGTAEKLFHNAEPSKIAIAHTRWATHGKPSVKNAQPHGDCKDEIAVVENGIVSNADELTRELLERGHRIISECDAEPLAHYLEELLPKLSWFEALRIIDQRTKGLYTVLFLDAKNSRILGIKRGNPLYIGISKNFFIASSDLQAMAGIAESFIPVKDGEFVLITKEGVEIRDRAGEIVKRPEKKLEINANFADKGDFETFMLKEIYEQATAAQNAILLWNSDKLADMAAALNDLDILFIIGSGSSYNAGVLGSQWLNSIASLPTYPFIASEAEFWLGSLKSKGYKKALLAISQSGETQHVLQAVKNLKENFDISLALVNVEGSQLTFLVDSYLNFGAGPEISVLATKTFMNEILVLYELSLKVAEMRGILDRDEISERISALSRVPEKLSKMIAEEDKRVAKIAPWVAEKKGVFYLSHGLNYGTALEGALKLKEVSYLHAEALPSGELLHGHLALVEKDFLSIFLVSGDQETVEFIEGNISEVKSRDGSVVTFSAAPTETQKRLSDHFYPVKVEFQEMAPFFFTPYLQLLAYHVAKHLNRPIDRPRNLAKTITVT